MGNSHAIVTRISDKEKRMKVLWLASWYPHKMSPHNGDFIQRHAKAVTAYHDVDVFFVVRDKDGIVTKNEHREKFRSMNFRERIAYYFVPKGLPKFLQSVYSQWKYERLFRQQIHDYFERNPRPELVHVHVGMKAGRMAQWLKRRYNIPYVITEHWTGFLPESEAGFEILPPYLQRKWKELAHGAIGLSAVSSYLADNMKKKLELTAPVKVIPNVVDTEIFHPATRHYKRDTQFIHISGLYYQKNFDAILQAFSKVKESNPGFQLKVYGPVKEEYKALVKQLGLDKQVSLHHEIDQEYLATYVQQSDALVLYSRYETFGCVLIEANAAGVPAIVSDIPVFHEIIREGENGVFVKGESPDELAKAILHFMSQPNSFDPQAISAAAAARYNYTLIGKQISDWYEEVLAQHSSAKTSQPDK